MTNLPRLAVTREQAALLSNGFNDLTWGKDAFALRLPERPTIWRHVDHARQTRVPILEGTRVEVGWWDREPAGWWENWHPVAYATLAEVRGDGRSGHDFADFLVTLSEISGVEITLTDVEATDE